jgi:uncharacterized protein (DUF983 family)
MPENIVHCRTCRELLNSDLEHDTVEIPAFVPLQEIASVIELAPRGYYLACPSCSKELRVNAKYIGQRVTCKNCDSTFKLDFDEPNVRKLGFYADCPHCQQRIRMAAKYNGVKVACKHCSGHLIISEPASSDSHPTS